LVTELRTSTHQHKLQPIDVLPFLVAAGANQPQKTVNTTQAYITMLTGTSGCWYY